jgi:hypothetical protein
VTALAILLCGAFAAALLAHPAPSRSLAAPLPPSPPAFVPSPIGPPPAPPTTPTPTPATTPASTPTATPTATSGSAKLDFSLDAARLSKAHDPGDLRGLLAVRPGTTTWLMMYFTLRTVPKKMSRLTTYAIEAKGKTVFKLAYKTSVKPGDVGRFSRYAVYKVNLPYGRYVYRATLTIGRRSQSKTWKFAVAKREQETATSSG